MLEMMYFHAELVQLIVSRSDSELEMQRYGMKKNTLTVYTIMLQDELWMRQRKNRPQTAKVGFYPCDAMLAWVYATAMCPSVCLSVCHTPVLCLVERKQDREMHTIW